jgi:hypothetical protein
MEKSMIEPFQAHLLPLTTKFFTSYLSATETYYQQFLLELTVLSENDQLLKMRSCEMKSIASFDIRLYDYTLNVVELQDFKTEVEQRLIRSYWGIL